ncbi:MAG: GntR family transcriptional regulator [Bacillota bacterium]|nr:GntR family transcriptional regulator [Bacillota bacterium]
MKKLGGIADNNSLRMQVFKEIEMAILNGTFSPGDSLTEIKLSEQLGVSRTPVRDALHQLELEGLVKNIPNKGAVVVGVSEKDIEDIYTIRMHIEGLAARWAAQNITDEEIGELREIVELQEFYVSREDPLQVWQLDGKFHELLYESSRSRPLKQTLSQFHHYIQKAREVSIKTANRAEIAVKEHRDILTAIAEHDGERAEELTREHIISAKNNLLRIIHE